MSPLVLAPAMSRGDLQRSDTPVEETHNNQPHTGTHMHIQHDNTSQPSTIDSDDVRLASSSAATVANVSPVATHPVTDAPHTTIPTRSTHMPDTETHSASSLSEGEDVSPPSSPPPSRPVDSSLPLTPQFESPQLDDQPQLDQPITSDDEDDDENNEDNDMQHADDDAAQASSVLPPPSPASRLAVAPAAASSDSTRRQSRRVDLKARLKAARPTVRFEPKEFKPPTLEEFKLARRGQKRKKLEEDTSTHSLWGVEKHDPSIKSEEMGQLEPQSGAMKMETSATIMPNETSLVKSEPMDADDSMPPPPSPHDEDDATDASDSDDSDLFPSLVLPTKFFILKSRLPATVRKMLHSRRYRAKKKLQMSNGGAPSGDKKRPSVGGNGVTGGSNKKKSSITPKNVWSESDDDIDNRSTASDRMLDAIYNEDSAQAPVQKRKKKSITSYNANETKAKSTPRTPDEQRQYDLANFGAYSDIDDDEINVNAHVHDDTDDGDVDGVAAPRRSRNAVGVDDDGDSDLSDSDVDDGPKAGLTNAEAKKARKEDEIARIKLHASMELAERRAYDKLVQNDMNDAYAFCDSNPRTMILSRDSLLIKLDLSDILNNGILDFFSDQQRTTLMNLLPACDRSEAGMKETFIAPIFLQSLYEYQELLMTGSLDPDMREMRNVISARRRRELQDSWKNKNFERYWGEQYSTRYSNKSEDRGAKTKGPSNVYWKPPQLRADFHQRQMAEGLLVKCVSGDIFAIRRRKHLLIKDRRWPLPSMAALKAQRAAGIAASSTPMPSSTAHAAAAAEHAKKSKPKKKDAAPTITNAEATTATPEDSASNNTAPVTTDASEPTPTDDATDVPSTPAAPTGVAPAAAGGEGASTSAAAAAKKKAPRPRVPRPPKKPKDTSVTTAGAPTTAVAPAGDGVTGSAVDGAGVVPAVVDAGGGAAEPKKKRKRPTKKPPTNEGHEHKEKDSEPSASSAAASKRARMDAEEQFNSDLHRSLGLRTSQPAQPPTDPVRPSQAAVSSYINSVSGRPLPPAIPAVAMAPIPSSGLPTIPQGYGYGSAQPVTGQHPAHQWNMPPPHAPYMQPTPAYAHAHAHAHAMPHQQHHQPHPHYDELTLAYRRQQQQQQHQQQQLQMQQWRMMQYYNQQQHLSYYQHHAQSHPSAYMATPVAVPATAIPAAHDPHQLVPPHGHAPIESTAVSQTPPVAIAPSTTLAVAPTAAAPADPLAQMKAQMAAAVAAATAAAAHQ